MKNRFMTVVVVAVVGMCLSGCISTKDPVVEATKPWEGRYTSLEDASKALDKAATTENDHQVWVLQPSTLSRLLKNASGK